MKIKICLIGLYLTIFNNVCAMSSNTYSFEGNKLTLILAEKKDNFLDLGLYFQLQPGWKIYWVYPGDAGSPPKIKVEDKKLFKNHYLNWPMPTELFEEEIPLTTRIYENDIIIPLGIFLNENPHLKKFLQLTVDYQICREVCIPISTDLTITLPETNYLNDENTKKLQEYKIQVPKEISKSQKFSLNYIKKNLNEIKISIKKDPEFKISNQTVKAFLQSENLQTFRMKNFLIYKDEILIKLIHDHKSEIKDNKVKLFFQVGEESFFTKSTIYQSKINIKTILFILVTAFFAGFILNFMPCVLPVLGIKISNFLKQLDNNKKTSVQSSSIYISLGIIATFLIIASFTSLLRAVGKNVGWGMQFQQPSFLIFLIFVLLIFFINLLGGLSFLPNKLFVNTLKINEYFKKSGHFLNNFATGIVSTILATPCTAPFVGTAISFALSQNYFFTYAIFLIMGIGKSLPYFIFIFKPNIINYFPKPGPWMKYMKYFFAFLLLVTIFWLGSIVINNFKDSNLKTGNDYEIWEEFSLTKLEKYRANENTVFIDITADWCVTCQINKKNVFESDEIEKIFKAHNVILLRADWTFSDDEILNFLKAHNKYGIPFNMIFSKKAPNGHIFNEVLLKKSFIKEVNKFLP